LNVSAARSHHAPQLGRHPVDLVDLRVVRDPDRLLLNHIRPQRIGRRVKQRAALPRPPDTASVELGERIGSQPERPSGPSQRGGGVSLDRDFDLDERVRL